MKYIRTKDGIVEITKELSYCYMDKDYNEYEFNKYIFAHTIEELCDEFVEYNREKNKGFYIREYELKECRNVVRKEPSILEHTDIFGAIWTDKGLIYVAKMNKKGELELL